MDKASEAWRAEFEARYAASLPTEKRKEFYEAVLAKRGREAANQLIDATNVIRRLSAFPSQVRQSASSAPAQGSLLPGPESNS